MKGRGWWWGGVLDRKDLDSAYLDFVGCDRQLTFPRRVMWSSVWTAVSAHTCVGTVRQQSQNLLFSV